MVSPEPVEVNSKRPYDKRVSPVVAEVVAYDSEILPAVVSTTGLEAVPEMKPFCDMTGPENVVFAMIFPYMQVGRICLHVVSRDCQIHRKTPEWFEYTAKEKGALAPFPQVAYAPAEPHIPRGSDQPKL
jgi:hypothetical protein